MSPADPTLSRQRGVPDVREPTVVCVVGAHRSGTSVAAAMLRLLGVELGRDDELLKPVEGSNAKGFFEHARIVRVNETILRRLGGNWRSPPRFEAGWQDAPELADLRRQAREIVAETFRDAPLWGWKDPRNSLTLPFWHALVPRMRYVVCLRNPGESAASLSRRDDLELDRCYRLWLDYTAAALRHSAGSPRVLIEYEDWFSDPDRQLELLAGVVGLPADAIGHETREAARAWLEPELHTQQRGVVDLIDDPAVPLQIRSLYLALAAAARSQRAGAAEDAVGPSLDVLAREVLRDRDERRELDRRASAHAKEMAAANADRLKLEKELAQARGRLSELERWVGEERAEVAADLQQVARSASWRFGHRVFSVARALRFRRSSGTSALDRAIARVAARGDATPGDSAPDRQPAEPAPAPAPPAIELAPQAPDWEQGIRAAMRARAGSS